MKCRCGLSYVDHEYGIVFKNKYTRFAFEEDRSTLICLSNRLSFESVTVISLSISLLIVHVHQMGEFTPFSTLGACSLNEQRIQKFHLHNRGFITWVQVAQRHPK
jgi:hypothetical protein